MKLSVIMPIYNEKNTIHTILKRVQAVDVEKEIIIVDDCSKDGTRDILKDLDEPNVKVLFHEKNQGKGMAIRTAIPHLTGEIAIIQDGDLEYDPQDYLKLMKPIEEKKYKVVYGSRHILRKKEYLNKYYWGTMALNFLVKLLYNQKLTDEPTCYKVFDANLLKSINLKCKRFEFCPEVTAKVLKKGHKILELPISYSPRTVEEGKKINWKDGAEGIWTLVKYRFVD